MSLNNQSNLPGRSGRREDALARGRGRPRKRSPPYRAGRRPPRRVPPRPRLVAEQPVELPAPIWGAGRTRWPRSRTRSPPYRQLAAARPDAFLPDLAMSLNNQSNCLADLGRREDALAAVEELATAYRQLAAARPHVFSVRLISSRDVFATLLELLGRESDADQARAESGSASVINSWSSADALLISTVGTGKEDARQG